MTKESMTREDAPTGRRSPALFLVLFLGIGGISAAILVVLADSNAAVPTPVPVRLQGVAGSLVNQPAPDFVLDNLDGEPVRLSDFRGQPLFLNFWATWCGPCRREMPAFQAFLEAQGADGALILTVDDAETPEVIRAFFAEIGVENIPVVIDPDSEIRSRYGVFNLPTTFLIDAAGIVRAIKLGEMTLEDLYSYVGEL
jgi:thiol-disulfide isomerase/thioredoxin